MILFRNLRDRVHPLNMARKYSGARAVLNAVDVRVWVRPKRINFPVQARLVRHASGFLLGGGVEPGVAALFLALASEFRIQSFWDVGANFGYYAWLTRSALPDCDLSLFEPDPDNAELIRATVRRSGVARVRLRRFAVSDVCGTAEFQLDAQTGSTGQIAQPFADTFGQRQWGVGGSSISVHTCTLDSERSACAAPDLIKVDVEGHEEAVFRGARSVIQSDQPLFIFECFHGGAEIGATLRSAGYRIFDADRAAPVAPPTSNFFALPARFRHAERALLQRWRTLIR